MNDSQSSIKSNHEVLPLFSAPDLRQNLDTYLDIVTDYTTVTKKDVKVMQKSILYQSPGGIGRFAAGAVHSHNQSVSSLQHEKSLQNDRSVFITNPQSSLH